jgi:phospholipid/cholesterol/gamma-HCH transport system substrate-binding protein
MNDQQHGTAWKVGLFIAVALGVLAVMAVKFGKLGTGLEKFYPVVVEFPDASGLLKRGEIYLAGDRIGFAEDAPSLIEGRYAVRVTLRIREGVKIPKGSRFVIGSSGLMGDSYVAIELPEKPNMDDVLEPGAYVIGGRKKGLGDLTTDASGVVEQLKNRLEELKGPIEAVQGDVLGEKNRKALAEALENMRDLSSNLKNTSKDLDDVMLKAKAAASTLQEAMETAKGAMGKVDSAVQKVDTAAGELKPALSDLHKAAESATKTVDAARLLIAKVNRGEGALGLLLSDKETADNLKALIRNLKQRGILFYKDRQ